MIGPSTVVSATPLIVGVTGANGASVTTGASVLGASVTGASELGVEFDEPESSPEQANNARTETMDTARTQRRMTDSPIDT